MNTNFQWESFYMPNDVTKVNDTQGGIYFFSLRFPTNYELGMKNKDKDIQSIINNIMIFLDLYENINNTSEYTGVINDKKAEHIKNLQDISIIQKSAIEASKLLSDIQIHNKVELEEVIEILRTSLQFSNPIYVGLAKKQSLQQRLTQHLSGTTGMQPFMKIHGLTWDRIQYNCFPVKNLTILRKLEKVIQNLYKPKFSTL